MRPPPHAWPLKAALLFLVYVACLHLQHLQVMAPVSASGHGIREDDIREDGAMLSSVRHARHILDADVVSPSEDDPDITAVRTAAELQAAIMQGVQDILIQDHLDLSDLNLAFNANRSRERTVLGEVKPSTRSIRGDCTSKPPSAGSLGLPGPEIQWKAPQCVIIGRTDFLYVDKSLWIDSLYLRPRPSMWYPLRFIRAYEDAALYATNVTLQGNGPFNTTAFRGYGGSRVLFQDCTFDSMGGQIEAFLAQGSSLVLKGAVLSNILQRDLNIQYDFEDEAFQFTGIFALSRSSALKVEGVEIINVDAVNLFWTSGNEHVLAESLKFSNVTTADWVWDNDGVQTGRTTDSASTQTTWGEDALIVPYQGTPTETSPLNTNLAAQSPFLSLDDKWITTLVQALVEATPGQIQYASEVPSPITPPLGVAGDAPASIAAVYTAQDFQDAFHAGIRDIEVHAHLDLRDLPVPVTTVTESSVGFVIGNAGPSSRSIRGKCVAPPDAEIASAIADLELNAPEPWHAPRCILLASEQVFFVDRSRLWIDSLHIQFIEADTTPRGIDIKNYGHAYVTNTVVQGDRKSKASAVSVLAGIGGIYAEDCVFHSLQGADSNAAVVVEASRAFFQSCVFRDLMEAYRVPNITPKRWEHITGTFDAEDANSTLALSNCTLTELYGTAAIVVHDDAQVYSDNASHEVVQASSHLKFPPAPLSKLPTESQSRPPPMQASDTWFVAARATLRAPAASAYLTSYPLRGAAQSSIPAVGPAPAVPAPTTPGTSEAPQPPADALPPGNIQPGRPGEIISITPPEQAPNAEGNTESPAKRERQSSPSSGLIAGAVAAVVAILLLCVAVVLFVTARKKKQKNRKADTGTTPAQDKAHNGISGIDNVRPGGPESEHPATAEGLQGSAAGDLQQNQNPGNGFHAVAVAGVDQHPHGHPQGLQHAQYYAQQMCYGPGIPFQYLPGMPGTGGKEHDAAGNGLPPVNMQPDPGKPSWGNHGEIGAAVQGNHATQGGPPGGTAVAGGPHGGMTAFYGRSFVGSVSEGQHSSLIASTATLTSVTKMTWTDFQKASGAAGTPLEALEVALDAMSNMQVMFCKRYQLNSAVERRVGGQGIVQFASISGTHDKAAIKLYLDWKAFARERELYTQSKLKTMMPATLAVEDNLSGEVATPYGYTFPPFVIIECGQSLDEWARDTANKDFITIFQALVHVVRALKSLHEFGYAHRDIKPGNILRRPKQHDWTLIDFGCTEEIGSSASLSYSLKYAAPEVVHELEAGSRTIHVDSAVDIWAVGVIAFELLTGERAFSSVEANSAAQDAIAGRILLPWEGPSEATQQRLEKLRGLRRTVMRCLERDPARRPTAAALTSSWDHTFDNMQTMGTDWSA